MDVTNGVRFQHVLEEERGKRAESLCYYIEEGREGQISVIELGSLIREPAL